MLYRAAMGRALLLLALCCAPVAVVDAAPSGAASAGRSGYLGANQCRICHEAEYVQWAQTPHARAAEVLTPRERRDPRCTACHSTQATKGLENVQCESCHGPGRHYWPEYVMRDMSLARAVGLTSGKERATCKRCHTPDAPQVVPFDFKAALLKVQHR